MNLCSVSCALTGAVRRRNIVSAPPDFPTIWARRRRPGNAMERWDGRIYWRALARGGRPAAIATIMLKRKEVEA